MKTLFSIIFITLCVATLLLFLFQRSLIYFPSREKPGLENFYAQDMKVIALKTKDGLVLNSWYKAAVDNKPTLLYLHGNAGHIGYRMSFIRPFLDSGFGALLLEYRGYGGNPGHPSEEGLYLDAEAAMEFLSQQNLSNKKIIIYGESLGTAVATYLATQFSLCALVLQSPLASLQKVAKVHYPWIPIPPRDKYDSLERIDKIKVPLLILHGEKDTIVPKEQAQLLFQKAHEPKEILYFPDKGHNDLWNKAFIQKVLQFIEAHCSKNSSH